MAYNEDLVNKIREMLINQPDVEEKKMMGGLTFMVDGKMCIGVVGDEMMCRISPDKHDESVEKTGCREMDFTGKPMRGYVFVNEDGMKTQADFMQWISLCLDFNVIAKASKKKNLTKKI